MDVGIQSVNVSVFSQQNQSNYEISIHIYIFDLETRLENHLLETVFYLFLNKLIESIGTLF